MTMTMTMIINYVRFVENQLHNKNKRKNGIQTLNILYCFIIKFYNNVIY